MFGTLVVVNLELENQIGVTADGRDLLTRSNPLRIVLRIGSLVYQ
jgi:hypothetical protein